MKSLFITLYVLCIPAAVLFAQSDINAEAVFLSKRTNVTIDVVNGTLEIIENNQTEKAFYKNFEKHSRESVHYSDFDPIEDFQAFTLIPNGSSYKKVKVSTVETSDAMSRGIFYGGYKRKDFIYPMLSAGAIGKFSFTKKITDVHFLNTFYFDEDVPVEISEFKVTFPQNVSVQYKLYGTVKDNIKFNKTSKGDLNTYTWTLENVQVHKTEKDAPARSYTVPHIIFYIDSYEHQGKKIRVLSDVSDLYRWYSGLIKRIQPQNNSILKALTDTLIRDANTNEEKSRLIFQWVQKNIKYIAFENGMGGFVPRASLDVYTKRYGDCKDMANLLRDLLSLAGVDAYHTWIGTRARPYRYEDIPTAIADDHMICAVKNGENFIFLDATNPFLSYGNPSSMIQGKEALIGLSADNYKIVVVPSVSANGNLQVDSLKIELTKDGLKGSFASQLIGYKKDDLEVNQLKAEINNDRENVRDFFEVGGNNIAISNLILKGIGNQDLPANVTFDFIQPGYYKSISDKVYINLNLNKTLPGERIDVSTRDQSLEQDYHYIHKWITILNIPEGYKVNFMPQNTTKKWDEFTVTSSYRTSENTIVAEKIIQSNYLYLSKDKFQQWNDFLALLNTLNQQSVVLQKQ